MSAHPPSSRPVPGSIKDRVTVALLGLGMTVPLIYYGIQMVAAPYFADYSFVTHVASLLGSNHSTNPVVFNTGVMATGSTTIVAAFGFFLAFRRIGANPFLNGLTCVALLGCGIASLWAGYFPMPDPRHAGHPAFLVCMLSLSFLLTVTLWKERNSRPLKAYLIATIALLIGMIPIMSGSTSIDNRAYAGILQRILAFTIFPPIGVCAGFLAWRIQHLQTYEPTKLGSAESLPQQRPSL
ncbi:hypothetical protein BH10PLA2_BH10PLA2_38340 [soil metagenome]